MTTVSLGDRIKRYEEASKYRLAPRQPLLIRVDGRAFHTYTRGMDKPFDRYLMRAMRYAMGKTADDMQGFKLAYHQSDEVTFLLTDYDRQESQGWFDYELNKVVSVSASSFTAHFNAYVNAHTHEEFGGGRLATFDSRAFTVPVDDVPNVFVWRQRDWERNSVTMLAQANFSHKELDGKKLPDMHDMLHDIGVNWAQCTEDEKNGSFLLRNGVFVHEKASYDQIRSWIEMTIEREEVSTNGGTAR